MKYVNDTAPNTEPSLLALSALVDSELEAGQIAPLVQASVQSAQLQQAWKTYHLIGDSLRAHAADVIGSRGHLPSATALADNMRVAALSSGVAANDSVWRWKMLAGVAGVMAVGALVWNIVGVAPGTGGAVLAGNTQNTQGATTAVAVANATPPATSAVMIRDQRLDELLAAHKQFGGASALQQPAGFLRNANFPTAGR